MRKKNQPGCPCCPEDELPATCAGFDGIPLFLTDANGTHAMTHIAADNYYVSYQYTPTTSVSFPGGICTKASNPCWVLYKINCIFTTIELQVLWATNNDPCGGSSVHPYQVYPRSDSAPSGSSWGAVNAGGTFSHTSFTSSAVTFTVPATGNNGPPFHDTYDYPGGGGTVTITP